MVYRSLIIPLICAAGFIPIAAETPDFALLLDDFRGTEPAAGLEWQGFTDRVMGGRSDMSVGVIRGDDESYLRMSGRVSLENNGGFIQVRLKLADRPKVFDASGYSGVRLTVRGSGGDGFYLFARTRQTRFPWKYYSASFPVGNQWRTVDLPWSAFQPGNYGSMGEFRPDLLLSIAVTAAFREFSPELEVREIGLY